MMPVLRITLLSKEVQRKSTMRIEDAVLRCRLSYERSDCTPPPSPGSPFSPTQGPKSNGFGGGCPGAAGRYNNKSSSSSMNVPAETTIRVNNKINGGNNSSRKCKSPTQNDNDWQQAGDDDNDEDAKMGGESWHQPDHIFFVTPG